MQQAQIPKRPHLAHLPSGRVLEFGNVIDCVEQGDTVELTQQHPNGFRLIALEGEDAAAALTVMRGIAMIACKSDPQIVKATVMPPTPKRRMDA